MARLGIGWASGCAVFRTLPLFVSAAATATLAAVDRTRTASVTKVRLLVGIRHCELIGWFSRGRVSKVAVREFLVTGVSSWLPDGRASSTPQPMRTSAAGSVSRVSPRSATRAASRAYLGRWGEPAREQQVTDVVDCRNLKLAGARWRLESLRRSADAFGGEFGRLGHEWLSRCTGPMGS